MFFGFVVLGFWICMFRFWDVGFLDFFIFTLWFLGLLV